jgi:hypothetical protein
MIQPLRRTHRAIFFVLGIALPILFVCGLVARHAPLSTVGPVEGKLAQENRGAEFALHLGSSKFKARLVESKRVGTEREFLVIPDSGFLAPDVFVYWSEAEPGTSLNPNAKLLGKLGPRELYRIPVGPGGYFVLYSVAQNEVLGSIPVGAVT